MKQVIAVWGRGSCHGQKTSAVLLWCGIPPTWQWRGWGRGPSCTQRQEQTANCWGEVACQAATTRSTNNFDLEGPANDQSSHGQVDINGEDNDVEPLPARMLWEHHRLAHLPVTWMRAMACMGLLLRSFAESCIPCVHCLPLWKVYEEVMEDQEWWHDWCPQAGHLSRLVYHGGPEWIPHPRPGSPVKGHTNEEMLHVHYCVCGLVLWLFLFQIGLSNQTHKTCQHRNWFSWLCTLWYSGLRTATPAQTPSTAQ